MIARLTSITTCGTVPPSSVGCCPDHLEVGPSPNVDSELPTFRCEFIAYRLTQTRTIPSAVRRNGNPRFAALLFLWHSPTLKRALKQNLCFVRKCPNSIASAASPSWRCCFITGLPPAKMLRYSPAPLSFSYGQRH